MQAKIRTGLWVSVVSFMCLLLCCFIFAGCSNTNNNIDNSITGNEIVDVKPGGGSTGEAGLFAGSGSQSSSNGIITANPSSGSILSHWTRTKGGVTCKYSTDPTVAEASGSTFTAVFVEQSTVVYVDTASELSTAMAGNKYIVLTTNIDATSGFTAPSAFSGVLDGAGYSITVNKSTSDASVYGLCGTLTGVIKNVVLQGTVSGIGISTAQKVGGFAVTINGGLISRCENKALVRSGGGTACGFIVEGAGTARGSTVYYSINYASVTGNKVGVVVFTNGTTASPYVNLVKNENYGAVQTNSVVTPTV